MARAQARECRECDKPGLTENVGRGLTALSELYEQAHTPRAREASLYLPGSDDVVANLPPGTVRSMAKTALGPAWTAHVSVHPLPQRSIIEPHTPEGRRFAVAVRDRAPVRSTYQSNPVPPRRLPVVKTTGTVTQKNYEHWHLTRDGLGRFRTTARENPMSKGLIIGLVVGAVVVVGGGVAYAMTRKSSSATSPLAGITAPAVGALTVPPQFVQGHRYQLVVSAPLGTSYQQQTPQTLQAAIDSMAPGIAKVQSLYIGSTATNVVGVAIIDDIGGNYTTPAIPATYTQGLAQNQIGLVITDQGVIPQ